jgi:hypothetical protein
MVQVRSIDMSASRLSALACAAAAAFSASEGPQEIRMALESAVSVSNWNFIVVRGVVSGAKERTISVPWKINGRVLRILTFT